MTDRWTDDGRTEKNVALAHLTMRISDAGSLVEFRAVV